MDLIFAFFRHGNRFWYFLETNFTIYLYGLIGCRFIIHYESPQATVDAPKNKKSIEERSFKY